MRFVSSPTICNPIRITDYRHHLAHTSATRRFLHLRASARKLYHLVGETIPAAAEVRRPLPV
jgi:hypothetical protein